MAEKKSREDAKFKRNKGQKAIRNSKMDEVHWCQKHDPLFKVKGMERHLKIRRS